MYFLNNDLENVICLVSLSDEGDCGVVVEWPVFSVTCFLGRGALVLREIMMFQIWRIGALSSRPNQMNGYRAGVISLKYCFLLMYAFV